MRKKITAIGMQDSRSRKQFESRIHNPESWHTILTVAWLAGLLLSASGQLYGQAAAPGALPLGDGKELVEKACAQCHGLRLILMLRDGPVAWKNLVGDMVVKGAQLMPEEAETVARYLAKNFGPGRNPMKTGKNPPGQTVGGETKAEVLPAGPGKELVESRCGLCHDLVIITAVLRSKQDWESIVKNMFARGLTATPDEIRNMTSYLTIQFGAKGD
jgi:cytochrome c5